MTLTHLAAICFNGSREAAKKRLQKLKAMGFVGERPRKPTEPSLLFLAKKGFELLQEQGELGDYPSFSWAQLAKRIHVSNLTLRHELDVMDVKASLFTAIAQQDNFQVSEFLTWPAMCQYKVIRPGRGDVIVVRPDGLLRVRENRNAGELFEHAFFIEVDRSTEVLDVLAQRVACYRAYYTSGGFAVRNGDVAGEYHNHPFRVLMIFKSHQRRDNVADRLLQLSPPVLSQAWLTTYAEAVANPLGPIWIEPRDRRVGASLGAQKPAQETKRHLLED